LAHLDFDIVSDLELRISYLASLGISTTVEDSLQISSLLTNKANFGKAQMNINIYYIKDYQIFIPLAGQKNKPNSNPIKPCPERSRMGQSPKSQNERKLNFNKGLQKKR